MAMLEFAAMLHRCRTTWALALLVGVLGAGGCTGRRAPDTPPATEPAPPSPSATPKEEVPDDPQPQAPSLRPEEPSTEEPAPLTAPRLLRVGLASDLAQVAFSCCGGELRASDGERILAVSRTITVAPARPASTAGLWTVQAAALRDEEQAATLASELTQRLGVETTSTFDAAIDLYRVRIGRLASREEADRLRLQAVGLGMSGAWVTALTSGTVEGGLQVVQGDEEIPVPGRWVSFDSIHGYAPFDGRRYRGRLLVYLNDRGLLNVINELPVEEYLRGVVPKELGPEVYGELEALKAQAVAARTYTLRNLGEFAGEGYDICATPRCQVYGGMDAEHPMSDRAVRETAGEVLVWHGELVDALYSSTCGGHTEDVEVVFPLKSAAYLRGVPCVEDGGALLPGRPGRGELASEVIARLLPLAGDAAEGDPRAAAEARLRALARLSGLPLPDDRLASLRRAEAQRFVASLFDLALDARLFLGEQDVEYLVTDPPPEWGEEDLRLAAYLAQGGWLAPGDGASLEPREIDGLILELARYLRAVEVREVTFLGEEEDGLRLRDGGEEIHIPVPPDAATYQEIAGRRLGGPVRALPGDRLDLYLHGERVLAVVHPVAAAGAAHDRSSSYSRWERFRTDRELAANVRERFPGFRFTGFEVLDRGVSGRVGAIRLHGTDDASRTVEGLAVRWTLDIPDTLFTARRLTPADGEPGWLFTGRGWGHGVGMCQVGAFGMARRGRTHAEILRHYYTDTGLATISYE